MEIVMSKYTIETLTDIDVDWFVEVAAINMLEKELKRPELVNKAHLYLLTQKVVAEGTAFIVKCDGTCVGALASILVPNMYNPEIQTLAELFWYVLPEYRNTRAGALLFSAFDDKGEDISDEAVMSLLGGSSVNIKTLEKRGFLLGEHSFRKEYRRK